MPRPPALPVEEKMTLILALLRGELTIAAAARRHGVSEQAVSNWRRQFLDGGRAFLSGTQARPPEPDRAVALRAENERLRLALGEALVQLRIWGTPEEDIHVDFEDLEAIRQAAEMPVTRFCAVLGVSRRTYQRHLCGSGAREQIRLPRGGPQELLRSA